MGKFLNGLFIGFGIGLFIAPQTGEETRHLIMERVVAWRKSMLSEDEPPISIEAHPPQISPFSAEPAQPVTEFFGEPEEQGTPDVSLAPPTVTFVSKPEEQGSVSVPSTDAPSTPSNQSTNVSGSESDITETEQASGSTPNPVFIPDTNPDQQTPAEMPRSDTAITEKLPPVSSSSSAPGRTARRKVSPRTSGTSKGRGHSKS